MQFNLFNPEKIAQTITIRQVNRVASLNRIIDSDQPTSAFVRNIIDILEITPKLTKRKLLLENLIGGRIISEYNETGARIKVGTISKGKDGIWISDIVSGLASKPMKEFLYAYNTIYKIAAFVNSENQFLVREGNTLNDSFKTAVNRAKLQFKHELDFIYKNLK